MPLIAYDRSGNIVASMDHLAIEDDAGVVRAVDFVANERAGVKLRNLWLVSGARGSTTWPEHLGHRFGEFRVELDPAHPLRGRRLVHRGSGHVRDRESIELDIERRKQAQRRAGRRTLDVRPFLGDAVTPLALDDHGRTRPKRDPNAPPPSVIVHRGTSIRRDLDSPVALPKARLPEEVLIERDAVGEPDAGSLVPSLHRG